MVFSYTISQQSGAYPGFQVGVKKKTTIGGLIEARIFFGIKISCKNRIFSICTPQTPD
jgi:hypothetical protein